MIVVSLSIGGAHRGSTWVRTEPNRTELKRGRWLDMYIDYNYILSHLF